MSPSFLSQCLFPLPSSVDIRNSSIHFCLRTHLFFLSITQPLDWTSCHCSSAAGWLGVSDIGFNVPLTLIVSVLSIAIKQNFAYGGNIIKKTFSQTFNYFIVTYLKPLAPLFIFICAAARWLSVSCCSMASTLMTNVSRTLWWREKRFTTLKMASAHAPNLPRVSHQNTYRYLNL